MKDTGQDIEAENIRTLLATYHGAMVGARTAELEDLLDADFSLVHITGYVQPKDEWLAVIRAGEFDYHRIDIDRNELGVSVAGEVATVTGRGIFDATINAMHAPWRLQFQMRWVKDSDRWRIASAAYSRF